MAFSDGTPDEGAAAATERPDYTPAAWPEPVPLLPRQPLDPLGTVLIPPTERRLFARTPAPKAKLPGAPALTAVPAAPALAPAAAPAARQEGAAHPRALRLPFGGGTEARRRRLVERIRTPLRSCHRIALLGRPAEGVPVTLGALLAQHRPDPVIVLDLADAARVSHADRRILDRSAAGRLDILAVRPDTPGPAFRDALTDLSGRYPMILSDTTAAAGDVQLTAVELADQLVICEHASADGARNASALIDHLTSRGHGDLVRGGTVVFAPSPPTERPVADHQLLAHFRTLCRDVVLLPAHTPGAPGRLRPHTHLAYLELAALVGDALGRV
ncbi:MinD/ParA family protein [Kitasatospora sp. NPDC086801]|uniref:MinD/ParA family ATP-binding protein n=1 Tax=Kitasatospora sp. NPDC086801 TaxID=3364066 RepID=UPI00380F1DBC